MSAWREQHSCGSASSPGAPASRRSSCGRGSGATACSRRSALAGGYRLYSEDDVQRVRRMRELLGAGLSAAEAARQARSEPPALAEVAPAAAAAAELRRALEQLDDAAAHAAFDRLLADYSTRAVLGRRRPAAPARARRAAGSAAKSPSRRSTSPRTCSAVACSALRAGGTAARARARCSRARRASGTTSGSSIFGLALREHGWRITFLGADTPPDTIVETVARLEPEALVSRRRGPGTARGRGGRRRASATPRTAVWVGGAGARAARRVRSSLEGSAARGGGAGVAG